MICEVFIKASHILVRMHYNLFSYLVNYSATIVCDMARLYFTGKMRMRVRPLVKLNADNGLSEDWQHHRVSVRVRVRV